jgi:hypothetical protein
MSRARVFYQCGCCGAFHPASFTGDCRDDFNRFNAEDLPDGWEEVSQDDESYIRETLAHLHLGTQGAQ